MVINSKLRRHDGRKTISVNDKDYPYEETFWDDWEDYRDGFRDVDAKKRKEKEKKKIKPWKKR